MIDPSRARRSSIGWDRIGNSKHSLNSGQLGPSCAIQRYGVPGGQRLDCKDQWILFKYYGTSYETAFGCKLFFVQCAVYAVMSVVCTMDAEFWHAQNQYGAENKSGMRVNDDYLKVVLGFLSFALIFFKNHVVSRFMQRYNEATMAKGAVSDITGCAVTFLGKARAQALIRYCVSFMFVYADLTVEEDLFLGKQGAIQSELLTPEEIQFLQRSGRPAMVLYQWSLAIVREGERDGLLPMPQSAALMTKVSTARELASRQIAHQQTQPSLPYAHLLNLMTHTWLIGKSWNASLDLATAVEQAGRWQAILLVAMEQLFLIFTIIVLWWTAVRMLDPMGAQFEHDTTDYDLRYDAKELWREGKCLLEQTFDRAQECPAFVKPQEQTFSARGDSSGCGKGPMTDGHDGH